MTTNYILAPNGRWSGRTPTGEPVIDGVLYTYNNFTRNNKATFSDPGGVLANNNPVQLDGKGEANIYWADDAYYSIELWTAGGRDTGQLVYTQDNYPKVSGNNSSPINIYSNTENLVRNPQFTFWPATTYPAITQSQNVNDFIADDWTFFRSNLVATVNISQGVFNIGQTDVPNSPLYYLYYECLIIGAGGETYKRFQQQYQSVQSLAGQQIAVAFYAKSPTASTISLSLIQNFGSGGSPSASVETIALSASLTNTWARFSATITLPSVAGKTLGTNGDDALILALNMPLNIIAEVQICNVQLHASNAVPPFAYKTIEEEFQHLVARIQNAVFKTGDVKSTLRAIADNGWLMMDDGTIGNPLSGANHLGFYLKGLYLFIWNSIANTYAPIFNSDGTVGSRGASAEADFNANKRLMLTRAIGRVMATAGQAKLSEVFTGDHTTSQLTIPDSSSFYTGTPVTLTTTGTLPAPLAISTTYYVINVDAQHIKLATSQANAVAATAITLTADGTATNTVSINYSNWAVGQFIGEEAHALTINELATHSHNFIDIVGGPSTGASGSDFSFGNTQLTGPAGGSQSHNNLQPTVFMNTMIKL